MKTLIRGLSMFGAILVLAACGGGDGDGGGSVTPAKAWGTAALIETDNTGSASAPQIAVDAGGNAIAVWNQYDGTRFNIYANRYTATTGTWGTAALIETDNAGTAIEPQIAIDAGGNAIAVWLHLNGTLYSMRANRYTATTGTWGTAAGIDIDLVSVSSRDAPRLAVDASGNAIAMWSRGANTTTLSIHAVRYVPGTGWGAPTLIETDDTGDADSPQIAFDANGNAIAVWRQLVTIPFFGGQRYGIRTNRYTAGTVWGTATLIDTGQSINNSDVPQVAVDASGNAIAVWQQSDGARTNIRANRYTVGTGWGTAELIETDNTGFANAPQIAFDAGGNAIAVWQQSDGARTNIRANRYTAGTGWGTAELIETDNTGFAESPQIAFDASGNAIAVWSQFDGARSIYANRYTAGNWGTPTLIETDNTGDALEPQIAIDASGNAIAVWQQYDGARNNIWANRYQ